MLSTSICDLFYALDTQEWQIQPLLQDMLGQLRLQGKHSVSFYNYTHTHSKSLNIHQRGLATVNFFR